MQSEELLEKAIDTAVSSLIEEQPMGHWRGDQVKEVARRAIAALSAAEPVAWTEPRELAKIEGDETGAFWKPRENERQIPLYASTPAPSVAVKALTADDILAGIKDQRFGYVVQDGKLTVGTDRRIGIDLKELAAFLSRSALSAQVQDVATVRDALQAIANLPTGFNIDVCRGHEEAYRAVEALLSTPPDVQVQDVVGWQPIETAKSAPNTAVLLYNGKRVFEGYWGTSEYDRKTKQWAYAWVSSPRSGDTKPTHWMPLPSAPAKQEG